MSYVIIFSKKIGDDNIEGIANFKIDGDKLRLDGLHLHGSSAGKIGRVKLFQIAKDLGIEMNVKEVVIQGGRRTTGRQKGKIPSPITIKVD